VSFEDIALVDNHAHPFLLPEHAAAEPFARFFGEASGPRPDTLFYRHALRELARLLACSPDEASVLAARQRPDYVRRLVEDARVEAVLLDDGYPRQGACTVGETAALGGFRAHRVLRLERLVEDLIPESDSLETLTSSVLAELQATRPGIVALKSIIAYRSGLAIDPADREQASLAFERVRARWDGRLVAKPLLDYVFHLGVGWAAEARLPLQLHTGFGDRDLDLRLSNPLHLRPLLEQGVLGRSGSPLVLLHASYPYVREAAYLANVYSGLYVDLSEASPLLAGPALRRVLEELLGLAPVTRLLYGSDAWGIPDWLWLAARATRRALGEAVSWLPEAEARWVARRVLRDNATELYNLSL
jgi:uncharacterized protein